MTPQTRKAKSRSLSVKLAILTVVAFSGPAIAQSDISQALDEISHAADQICTVVQTSGSATSDDVKGALDFQLKGLATWLSDAGIHGSAGISKHAYQGVLQQDLAAVVEHNEDCRERIFNTLLEKVLPNSHPTPPADPVLQSSNPQSDTKKIRICLTDPDSGRAFAISTDGSPDNVFGWFNGSKCKTLRVKKSQQRIYLMGMEQFGQTWGETDQDSKWRKLPICVGGALGSGGAVGYTDLGRFAVVDGETKRDCQHDMRTAMYHRIEIGDSNDYASVQVIH